MSTETKPRGICPECGQERQLTKSGHMRYHRGRPTERWYRAADCDGVGMLPRSVIADPVAAAEARGYARAIADLRTRADQLAAHDAEYARSYADFLESLAPKETP